MDDKQIKFYSVQVRENVMVPIEKVTVMVMKNGRKAAQATVNHNGKEIQLFKILGAEDKQKLGVTD